ncbi:L,D-transpeptidase family protein [Nocardia blacklockiae]|uniref:L,D-transpeptidase family protein n=1 Tax=Nocardia blacklockiae TaxID=480036 RepID=UPI0018939929|nr:L,D-transpeptidase family protein [Nocardia blacklockiae]MBF6172324.1 L,D-transpeptidase family protein [Nocardia blacklockiae]
MPRHRAFRHRTVWAAGFATALAAAVLVVVLPRIGGDRPPFEPASVPGSQVVWVTAAPGADRGTLELWQRGDSSRWERTLSVPAWVGAQGISVQAREGAAYTPEGTFTLTEAFGRQPATAKLPYLQVDSSNTWWWVSDTASPLYNRSFRCAEADCPFDTAAAENLGRTVPQYDYALVIDYNRAPVVAGAGSAFFVHVEAGRATAGCVAIAAEAMRTLLDTLRPSRRPVIGIHSA